MSNANAPVHAPAGFVPRSALSFGGDGVAATAVDAGHPLPVASGAPGSIVGAIAGGASLSGTIDLDAQRLHRVGVPIGWTAASISFQASHDGVAFADLYDVAGEVVLASSVVGAGRAVVVDPAVFLGVRFLKIRSGSAASPVAQSGQRELTLLTVAR